MDICHNGSQAKDTANTDDNTFKVVILFWNRLFSGSGHLNLTGRNFPLRPVSRAGQQNNFQIGLLRDFKREFALPVCGSLNELIPLWIRNDDFTRLYFFTAAEFAFHIDGISLNPGKEIDPVGFCAIKPEKEYK